ncbi:hypothetical protein FH972_004731 [Carpinus fangiana]|uniref:Ferric oxidoreductase domain-containing protein n=1 Tax=Carpinus fangiana TaxID=176857 RepID=A0A5N6QMF3_9ROSI|nr:hypothetical protein FH972_004731 [Carpinus fangiana]
MAWTSHNAAVYYPWTILLAWEDTGVADLAGVISLLTGLLMWLTSLYPVRKQKFELFFYTHQLYVVFVIFFALHVGDFFFRTAAGGIFLFLFDRFLRFYQSRRTVKIISAKCFPCEAVELIISKPAIRELSWLQWHPSSVSSNPLEEPEKIGIKLS